MILSVSLNFGSDDATTPMAVNSSSRSALSLEEADEDVMQSNNNEIGPPLDQRIIGIIQTTKDHTIRPARLATELGISVNDACAELCGLLQAVGAGEGGASFRFESTNQNHVMVFTFPPDFERRAYRKRRQENLCKTLWGAVTVAVKILKLVTAFGLILSLLIISIAVMAALVAALVALTRAGHDSRGHRSTVMRNMRNICMSMRQLLWFYAVFGGGEQEGQDPFMREIAYDMALVSGMCCGNPGSIFFWFRANQLHRRRRRMFQGWSGRRIETDVEGVTLIQRGTWDNENEEEDTESYAEAGAEGHRGLLSVAVEFLFGPTPFHPGPTEPKKWKLRAAALIQLSTASQGKGVKLEAIAPYVDSPPSSLDDSAKVLGQGLLVVVHFNGTPTSDQDGQGAETPSFVFPELMAESGSVPKYEIPFDNDDETWASFLYSPEPIYPGRQSISEVPRFLKERHYKFTMLSAQQLFHSSFLGLMNLIGVIWLGRSIAKGGSLEIRDGSSLAVLSRFLLPVLRFYAILFFVLPGARLFFVLVMNTARRRRNLKRESLATALQLYSDS